MNSCEEGQQASLLQSPISHQPSPSSSARRTRTTVIFGALTAVAVVAVLAACAAVAFHASGNRASGTTAQAQLQRNPATKEHQLRGMRERRRHSPPLSSVGPSTRPVHTTSDGSCVSQETESNVPAAHIKGQGIERGRWIESTAESGSVVAGYQQRWQCNDVYVNSRHQVQEQAFVDGGVWFNQTDKSIYVPTCGYYMIYSQVLFVIHGQSLTHSATVFHNLNIKHNCTWESDTGPIQLQAKASIAPYGTENQGGGVATTYTANVVHLCAGGSVWVEIPDGANGVPCCPRGEDKSTFLGLILLANTPCSSWPPQITMTHEY